MSAPYRVAVHAIKKNGDFEAIVNYNINLSLHLAKEVLSHCFMESSDQPIESRHVGVRFTPFWSAIKLLVLVMRYISLI